MDSWRKVLGDITTSGDLSVHQYAKAAAGLSGVINNNVSAVLTDIGRLQLDKAARPRPFPYSATSSLAVVCAAEPNFGDRLLCIPKATYNFGDSPNHYAIDGVSIENMSANDTYILMGETSPTGASGSFTPVGAIRFSRTSPQTRSFVMAAPSRPIKADENGFYVCGKSTTSGSTVTFSLQLRRQIDVSRLPSATSGVWPYG